VVHDVRGDLRAALRHHGRLQQVGALRHVHVRGVAGGRDGRRRRRRRRQGRRVALVRRVHDLAHGARVRHLGVEAGERARGRQRQVALRRVDHVLGLRPVVVVGDGALGQRVERLARLHVLVLAAQDARVDGRRLRVAHGGGGRGGAAGGRRVQLGRVREGGDLRLRRGRRRRAPLLALQDGGEVARLDAHGALHVGGRRRGRRGRCRRLLDAHRHVEARLGRRRRDHLGVGALRVALRVEAGQRLLVQEGLVVVGAGRGDGAGAAQRARVHVLHLRVRRAGRLGRVVAGDGVGVAAAGQDELRLRARHAGGGRRREKKKKKKEEEEEEKKEKEEKKKKNEEKKKKNEVKKEEVKKKEEEKKEEEKKEEEEEEDCDQFRIPAARTLRSQRSSATDLSRTRTRC
ncbi:Protein of unknown function, partial [Gryllus bimaculatus]